MTELRVDEPHSGYPGIAFGGFIGGLLARQLVGPAVQVHFESPVPVGIDLECHVAPDQRSASLRLGARLLARASALTASVRSTPPPPPTFHEAREAMLGYPDVPTHRQPHCFGCGPARRRENGLRVFTARVDGRLIVAGVWRPLRWTGHRVVEPEYVWSALDCPGAWASIAFDPLRGNQATVEMTCSLLRDVQVGDDHIVVGWLIDSVDGRRHVGSAMFTAEGELCASSTSTWVALRRPLSGVAV